MNRIGFVAFTTGDWPFVTDMKGEKEDPTIALTANAEYNNLAIDLFIILNQLGLT